MNYHKSAKSFEEYMKNEGFTEGIFEIRDKGIDYMDSVTIKSQQVSECVAFYENFVFIEFDFTNISGLDVQKRYEVLEIINQCNCDKKWECKIMIDEDNDVNLAYYTEVSQIDELSPEWLFNKLAELEGYAEELIPQIMKVMWS